MASVIKCPICGENNPSDHEFCQFCQSRLRPETDSPKGAEEGYKPGQIPTKKTTADLEPVLPEWLREARNSSRNSVDDNVAPLVQQPSREPSRPSSPPADLLAGLQAQSGNDDEEDLPDWLTSITGTTASPKKSQLDSSDAHRVELGGAKDFAQGKPAAENETPSWLANLAPSGPPSVEKDELTDWMREASGVKPQQSQPPAHSEPADSNTPDWLHQLAADDGSQNSGTSFKATPADSDTPDWLRQMAADDGSQNSGASFSATPADSDTPDWLRQMAADDSSQNSGASFSATPADSDTPDWLHQMADDGSQNSGTSFKATPADSDTPDWLRSLGAQDQAQSADSAGSFETNLGESDAGFLPIDETPDWLKGLGSESSSSALSSDDDWLKSLQPGKDEQPASTDVPSWLKGNEPAASVDDGMELPSWLSDTPSTTTPAAPVIPAQKDEPAEHDQNDAMLGDVPSWLRAAAPHSSIYGETPEEQSPAPAQASSNESSDDWLNAFKSIDTPKAPAFSDESDKTPPAFTPETQTGENMDALFTDMPDWLAGSVDTTPAAPAAPDPTPITNSDALAAGELPAWVQAMRPVDTGVSQFSSTLLSSDQTSESRGALAGLQGVLPAAPGYAPTSKPKAYSIKLKASDEQQTQSALLEQILAAEAEPVPIASFSALRTSRGLRWTLAFLLLAAITTVLAMRTQIFSMPIGNPFEINGALQAVQSIPEGAPVLVVFDYEPARVGEMEAAAAPLFDQMLLLHHPRLTFISTNEAGAMLAERFITGPLAGHSYQSGVQYLNLGFLPGGQMGIRAFAQNPSVAAPYAFTQSSLFDIALTPAWTLPPLDGVTSLSQFSSMIFITDNADSARAWIEQTTSARGAIPVVVISSAQAAPMIQPYYASRQIAGLVSGLYGGAVYEQNNAGRPGTARTYWDAYSIGMLLAMALILGGGLWNFALGLRDRAAAREAN